MTKQLIIGLGITAILFASCNKTDNDPIQTVPYSGLSSTTNYFQTFKGSDSISSVDFSGQTTRINMLKEIDAYMKTGLTTSLDAAKLRNMYENKNAAFTASN